MSHFLSKFWISSAVVATVLCAVPSAEARLFGEIGLGYTDFNSRILGEKRSGSSFLQRYTALYSDSGRLEGGRLGNYTYSLGYEWSSFDTRIKAPGETIGLSDSTGRPLFEGTLRLNPANLPLRLRAYTRDLKATQFETGSSGKLGGDIIDPEITTSLNNGTHIRSGVVLTYGNIKEIPGTFYGDLPLLTVDYTNEYDKDSKSISPTDTTLNRLAVMLSKGAVELSFLRWDFTDNITPGASYLEDSYTLGTVSYREGRKWIDLTNWIKLSADASYDRVTPYDSSATTDTYYLHLYGIAERDTWQVRAFNNLSRSMTPTDQSHEILIPVFASGRWNADTDWQVRLSANDSRTTSSLPLNNRLRTDLLASVRVDALKRSPFTLSPTLSVEQVEDQDKKTFSFVGSLESASTRRFSERYALYGSYTIAITNTEDPANANAKSTYVQNSVRGRGVYRASDQLRLELEETFTVGSGRNESDLGVLSGAVTDVRPTPGTGTERQEATNGFVQSVTSFKSSWVPMARLRFGLILSEDIRKEKDVEADSISTAAATVEYNLPSFSVGSALQMSKRINGGRDTTEITGNGSLSYKPDRTMAAEMRYNFSRLTNNDSVSESADVSQRYRYSFFTGAGLRRNWLNLTEELSYLRTASRAPGFFDRTDSEKRLTLGAQYYPTRFLLVSATIRYSLLDPGNVTEVLGSGGVGIVFPKFQANVDYSYGKRDGDNHNSYDTRVEQRISANVKKQF